MSGKKKRRTPEWEWEQSLIDDYYDYRWWQLLEPLYQKFQIWKRGQLDHEEVSLAIHKTNKATRALHTFFEERRDLLVSLIQLDKDWFGEWLKSHPAPRGMRIIKLSDG